MAGSPWAWHPHPFGWMLVAGGAAAFVVLVHHLALDAWPRTPEVTLRQKILFGAGLLVLAVALTWPVADLAHRSLLLRMTQQSLLLLVAPPLLLLGTPRWLVDLLTRPAPADTALRWLTRPVTATAVFNVVVAVSLIPVVVDGSASNEWAGAALAIGLLAAGLIMWAPALRVLPGLRQLGRPGRAGYLIVQSVVISVASLVFILAPSPLYGAYQARSGLGFGPLLDQQLAGALAKVAGMAVLVGTAAVMLLRTHQAEEAGIDADPLTWDDVERELRRLDRRPPRDSPKDSAT